jgi:hypothetical protein
LVPAPGGSLEGDDLQIDLPAAGRVDRDALFPDRRGPFFRLTERFPQGQLQPVADHLEQTQAGVSRPVLQVGARRPPKIEDLETVIDDDRGGGEPGQEDSVCFFPNIECRRVPARGAAGPVPDVIRMSCQEIGIMDRFFETVRPSTASNISEPADRLGLSER